MSKRAFVGSNRVRISRSASRSHVVPTSATRSWIGCPVARWKWGTQLLADFWRVCRQGYSAGEAGWLVDSNGFGTILSACRFAHFLALFLASMGSESFCRRYSITAHPTGAEAMAIEKFVPVKISLKANAKLFPLPLVLVNSPIRRFE